MKDGIILDGICCAYCQLEKGCKIKDLLDNCRHSAFCSNYEPDRSNKEAKSFTGEI